MKKHIMTFFCFLLVFGLLMPSSAFASEVAPMAVLKTEIEPNNTRATANLVNQDDTITGYIGSSSDIDYFKVVPNVNGVFNFWLGNIPAGKNYDLYVYNSSGSLLGSSTNTGTAQELVSGITATKGNTYYFAVQGKNGSYSATDAYKVRCRLLMNPYAGFSQTDPGKSATAFSTTNLDKLYSSGSTSSWLSEFKSTGCFIASYAMVLRNLGAITSTTHPDFRSGITGRLAADPFTVMLANTNWPTISQNSNGRYTANATNGPTYIYHNRIASSFGKTVNRVYLNGLSDASKANAIAYYLSLHPEGVIVFFDNGNGTHAIVFTQTTVEIPSTYSPPASSVLSAASYDVMSEVSETMINNITVAAVSSYDNSFTVCDPTGTTYYGAPESFSTSYAKRVYGLNGATRIFFFT